MSLSVLSPEAYVKQRLYTYEEALKIATGMANEARLQAQANAEKSMAAKYDTMYTLALVCSLVAEPFGFGKKRIDKALDLFFGQLAAFNSKAIDIKDFITVAEKVGVTIQHKDGNFVVKVR